MKNRIICILISLLPISCITYGQDGAEKWMVNASYGIEHHDKRLGGYADKEKLLYELRDDKWGTYHLGLHLHRQVWQYGNLKVLGGSGLSFERATILRPFDHFQFGERIYIFRLMDVYEKYRVPLSILMQYEIGNYFMLYGRLVSNFLVYRNIENTFLGRGPDGYDYNEGLFQLEDMQLQLGFNLRFKNILLGSNVRVGNYQRIDQLIFYLRFRDPRMDGNWEWYNPLNFNFTLGYMW